MTTSIQRLPGEAASKPFGTGAVLGKFMPAHRGHLHLIQFAAAMCGHLTVIVDCVPGEWPGAAVRAELLRADLAGLPTSLRVVALEAETPQQPGDHPQFWAVWGELVRKACGGVPDALVCSMDYGAPLAEAVGCSLVPLDIGREAVPLCATDIRQDPWGRWADMMPHARLPYLGRVAIEGPESTGKSTMARALAALSGHTYAPEWAKCYLEHKARGGQLFVQDDLLAIAHGQLATERSLELMADRVLICDSSLLTTLAWSHFLYGRRDPELCKLFEGEEARAPRARWLFTPETPWTGAEHRNVAPGAELDSTRWRFWDTLLELAHEYGLHYEVVPGGFAEKETRIRGLVADLGIQGALADDGRRSSGPGILRGSRHSRSRAGHYGECDCLTSKTGHDHPATFHLI